MVVDRQALRGCVAVMLTFAGIGVGLGASLTDAHRGKTGKVLDVSSPEQAK